MALRTTKGFPDGSPGSIQRGGYTDSRAMMADLARDMRKLGFDFIASDKIGNTDFDDVEIAENDYDWILMESTEVVDPLSDKNLEQHQRWRILMSAGTNSYKPIRFQFGMATVNGLTKVSWSTQQEPGTAQPPTKYRGIVDDTGFRIQITADTTVVPTFSVAGPCTLNDTRTLEGTANFYLVHHIGELAFNSFVNDIGYAFYRLDNWFVINDGLYNVYSPEDANKWLNVPITYRITVSDHGFSLACWGHICNFDTHQMPLSWVVVQRPVNPNTGVPLMTGKCPLFCVYGINPIDFEMVNRNLLPFAAVTTPNQSFQAHWGRHMFFFVVREADAFVPGSYRPADSFMEDLVPLINSKNQVVITESNQYIVTFPNGLTSERYCYLEELDLIAYTSADVMSQYATLDLTLYNENNVPDIGETDAVRTYMAMHSNGPYNTGVRILLQVAGPGITVARDFSSY